MLWQTVFVVFTPDSVGNIIEPSKVKFLVFFRAEMFAEMFIVRTPST